MTAWVLNAVGLLVTTIGALLIVLYLWKAPRFAEDWLSPEGKRAYVRHRRLLIISVALLAAWPLIQYLAIILV
jgi:hypothetical protein